VVGLLLIIPPVRHLVWRLFGRSINVRTYSTGFRGRRRRDDFVDLSPEDYHRQDDDRRPPNPRLRELD
jgi:UPF0716 family protein affecting phage T7 exclusion